MSLINDALKRASQNKPPAAPSSEPERPLQPVEYTRRSGVPFLLVPVVLLVLGLAGWFFFKGWQAQRAVNSLSPKLAVAARKLPPATPTNAVAQAPVQSASLKTNTETNLSALPTEVKSPAPTALTTNVPVAAAEPAKPSFPAVRLQGIFYRLNRPSAMINSKTVSVGEKVANTKVLAINRDSVTLEWNGETKVLTLE